MSKRIVFAAALLGAVLAIVLHAGPGTSALAKRVHTPHVANSVRFYTFDREGEPVLAPRPTNATIGHPQRLHSLWLAQRGNSCGPSSAVDALGQLGVRITEHDSISTSVVNGWYVPTVGMTAFGLADEINYFDSDADAAPETADITTIEGLLQAGQPVIAMIDAETIWHDAEVDPGVIDHFVTVTGYDPSTQTVFLNDTGSPINAVEEVPLSEFMDALGAQDTNTVVTTNVAGYTAIDDGGSQA